MLQTTTSASGCDCSSAQSPSGETHTKTVKIEVLVDLYWFSEACRPLLIDPMQLMGYGLIGSLGLFTDKSDDRTFQSLFSDSRLIVSGTVYTYQDRQVGRTQKFLNFMDTLEEVGIDEFPIRRMGEKNDDEFKHVYRKTVAADIEERIRTSDVDYFVLFCDHKVLQALPVDLADKIFAYSDVEKDSALKDKFRVKWVKGRDVFVFKSMYDDKRQF